MQHLPSATRRRRWRVGVAVVGVVIGLAVVLAVSAQRASTREPGGLVLLEDEQARRTVGLRHVEVGEVVVYGGVLFRNTGERDVRLTSARLVGDLDGYVVTGVVAVGPGPGGVVVVDRGTFPPPVLAARAIPLDQARIPPSTGPSDVWAVVVGLTVTNAREVTATGLDLSYTDGGRTHVLHSRVRLLLCPDEQCEVQQW